MQSVSSSPITGPGFSIVRMDQQEPNDCLWGISRRSLDSDERFPWQFNWLTAGRCFDPYYHRRIVESYAVIACGDDDVLKLDGAQRSLKLGTLFAIEPGCVHNGQCRDATILLCVLRKHSAYDDGDMNTESLPNPPSSGQRFVQHDLNDSPFQADTWPYHVSIRDQSTGPLSNLDHFVAHVVLPDQPYVDFDIDGATYRVGPGCLIALEPYCSYQFFDPVRTISYHMPAQGWEKKVDALVFAN